MSCHLFGAVAEVAVLNRCRLCIIVQSHLVQLVVDIVLDHDVCTRQQLGDLLKYLSRQHLALLRTCSVLLFCSVALVNSQKEHMGTLSEIITRYTELFLHEYLTDS